MVRNPIAVALCAVLAGLGVVLTLFTVLDLASGVQSTALYLGLVAWPVTAITGGYLARTLNRDRSEPN